METDFDRWMDRVNAGAALPAADIVRLAATPDILPLGMLADAARRRLHGARVTYLRVAARAVDGPDTDAAPPAAREIRITGAPATLEAAVTAVERARAVAGDRTVAGFSWMDVCRMAGGAGSVSRVLAELCDGGLDAVAQVPLDTLDDTAAVVDALAKAGFQQLRLGIEAKVAAERASLLLVARELQERYGCIQSINPLPAVPSAVRPTTGYEDVKMVAVARLAASNIPSVQVDWLHYGPKLAQVALAFGADDLDAVSASDEAPDGRRRAPLEEVHRNVAAAGFSPAERDGRFTLVI